MAKKSAAKKKPAKKTTKKKPSKALVKQKSAPLATPDLLGDAHLGFENADKESYSIPFLTILQTNSPQCDEDDGAYVKGAKAGSFFNTATQEVYSGKDGVLIIPCYYNRSFVEWVPRDEGGGFRGQHSPESIELTKLERDDSGKFVLTNGNHLADTRYHFCMLLTDEGPRPVVISMTSTQIKASKNWMTAMRDRRARHPETNALVPVPMMANIWHMISVTQSNDKGNWKGFKIEFDHMIEIPGEQDLFLMAKEFHHQVATGQAKAEEPAPVKTSSDGDDVF